MDEYVLNFSMEFLMSRIYEQEFGNMRKARDMKIMGFLSVRRQASMA